MLRCPLISKSTFPSNKRCGRPCFPSFTGAGVRVVNFILGQMSSGKISINKTPLSDTVNSVVLFFTELITVPVDRGRSDSAEKCNSGVCVEVVMFLRQSRLAAPPAEQMFGSVVTWEAVPPLFRSKRQSQLVGSEFIALLRVSTYLLNLHSGLFAYYSVEVDTL